MINYALRRLATVLLILVVMSLLVFLATHALPSDAAASILGQYSTPETLKALEHKLGLDLPLPVQYWRWARAFVHGDMGESLVLERSVAPMVWGAFGRSAILAVASMAIVATFGVTMGIIAAVWRGRWPDHSVSVFAYLGISVPEFYWGLVLILVFSSTLHLLPTSGIGNIDNGFLSYVSFLVLPVMTLALGFLAHVSRLTRSSMAEELDSMYVRVARARGLPEYAVILRHALRNALIPTITVLAQDFGYLIGGIVAIETVFVYPGLGQLLMFALQRQDLPVMQAAILILTGVFCISNLIADLLYGVINPRIRYGGAVG
jgi:peptide/nickel transport system permease protein